MPKQHRPARATDSAGQKRQRLAVGLAVRLRREHKKMSRRQLGEAMGVSARQIANYESGRDALPAVRVLPLCLALKISPNVLFGWVGGDGPTQAEIDRASEIVVQSAHLQSVGRTLADAMAQFARTVTHGLGLTAASLTADDEEG